MNFQENLNGWLQSNLLHEQNYNESKSGTMQFPLSLPFLNESHKLFSELESKGIVFEKTVTKILILVVNLYTTKWFILYIKR